MPHEESNSGVPGGLCRPFSLAELTVATNDFNKSFIIGQGGFALVYIGEIKDGAHTVTVAIKRLKSMSPEFQDDFRKEIVMVSKFRHSHLVSLIGYCETDSEMILVYEYMAGGTLEDNLHSKIGINGYSKFRLSWVELLKICIGAAQGLQYLHTGTAIYTKVIHRDVKSSNILLDGNRTTAKIADFGISKIGPANQQDTRVLTRVVGTPGYWDPSYFTTGYLSSKSDVYAFGVVLFEVLGGRPAVDRRLPKDQQCLAEWAHSCVKQGKIKKIIDPKLKKQISPKSLSAFVEVADRCLCADRDDRPTMTMVLAGLEFALKIQESGRGNAKKSDPASHTGEKKFAEGFRSFFSIKPRPNSADAATTITMAAPNDIRSAPVIEFIVVSPVQLDELMEITDDFGAKFLIYKGSYAALYWGILKSGQASFIRRLDFNELSDEEFLAQVFMVSKLKHENVVELLSYCVHGDHPVLAYEYAPKGSLHDILHGQKGAQPVEYLSWSERVKIAVGAAKGLQYLHEGRSNPIIYCEITSRNVLLFDDNVPKIADFNLSSQVHDVVARPNSDLFLLFTLDDQASECGMTEQTFSDIYCFGILLLELLTGREPHDYTLRLREQHLVKWATPKLGGDELKQCIDPRLHGKYPLWQAVKMASVASLCLQDEPIDRPSMSFVVKKLKNLLNDLR